jgi:hypothetical protein
MTANNYVTKILSFLELVMFRTARAKNEYRAIKKEGNYFSQL